MNQECVIAVYSDLSKARDAVHMLEQSDFPSHQLSVLTNVPPSERELARRVNPNDDSLRDAVVGGGIGAVVGALAGTAVSVVAGPFGMGLLGVVVGSFIGSMHGWGVHKETLESYEDMLVEGKILLVAYGNPLDLIHAQKMLQETDAELVEMNAPAADESPEVNPEEQHLHQ